MIAGVENKRILKSSSSRRGFLKAFFASLLSASVLSCEKDDLLPEEEEVEPSFYEYDIKGPDELSIPELGRHVSAEFSIIGEHELSDPLWRIVTPNQFVGVETFTNQDMINYNFSTPGTHRVLLYSKSSNKKLAEKPINVLAPPHLDEDYDMPILLLLRDSPLDLPKTKVPHYGAYTWDMGDNITKLFSTTNLYNERMNWSPGGDKFAFTFAPDEQKYPETPFKLAIYDMFTGRVQMISNNNLGIAWKPSWSPKGDWIAYLDDSEAIGYLFGKRAKHVYDEIALVRPDGSEQFFLRGEGDEDYIFENGPDYAGFSLSWDNTGTQIASGGSKHSGYKIRIFNDLFSGKPSSRKVPTPDQLEHFYDFNPFKGALSRDEFVQYAVAGANGTAWSPDGQYLAYSLQFDYDPAYNLMVMSRPDGTGEIIPLMVRSGNYDVEWVDILRSPTWSKNGKKLFCTSKGETNYKLYFVDMEKGKIHSQSPKETESLLVEYASIYD